MSTTPRPPLLSDEELQTMSGHGEMTAWEKYIGEAVRDRYEAARAKDAEEIAKWKGIVKGVHGALADIGDIPVPALDADLYDTVMSIRAKDAELIQMLVDCIRHNYHLDPFDTIKSAKYYALGGKTQHDALNAAAAAGFKPSEP